MIMVCEYCGDNEATRQICEDCLDYMKTQMLPLENDLAAARRQLNDADELIKQLIGMVYPKPSYD
jgi:hypothetical protein